MQTGLLWYDDSDADVGARALEAAERYKEKFGDRPNRCYVNPDCLEEERLQVNGMVVLPSQSVPPNHFWVGLGSGDGQSSAAPTIP
jgi:hypothetical protein